MNKTIPILLSLLLLICRTQVCLAQSGDDLAIPRQIQDVAGQFSLAEKMSLLELEVFGKSTPKKEAIERLTALEQSIFGKDYQPNSANLVDRIKEILSHIRPSNDLVIHLVQEKLTVPDWANRAAKPPWLNTSNQIISLLELEVTGKLNSKDSLVDRLQALETIVLPDKTPPLQAPISDRIAILNSQIQPTESAQQNAQKQLASKGLIGNGQNGSLMKSFGSKIGKYSQPARGVLKSPTFWLALIGAGTVVGLAFALRNSGNSSSTNQPVVYSNRACCGSPNCGPCKNCHDCAWCNQGGIPKCNRWFNPKL